MAKADKLRMSQTTIYIELWVFSYFNTSTCKLLWWCPLWISPRPILKENNKTKQTSLLAHMMSIALDGTWQSECQFLSQYFSRSSSLILVWSLTHVNLASWGARTDHSHAIIERLNKLLKMSMKIFTLAQSKSFNWDLHNC